MFKRLLTAALTLSAIALWIGLASPIPIGRAEAATSAVYGVTGTELPDDESASARVARGEPGFTYAPASRDWLEGVDYYALENEEVKVTVGKNALATPHPTDYSDNVSGNNKWGTLTPGHIMDAAPKFSGRENLDYTEFVLSPQVGRTWWYPTQKLSLPDIQAQAHSIVSRGAWDANPAIKAQVTYSLVERSPLIKMKVKLTNEGATAFTGHLGYIIDPEETLEQSSYVPGWGWRGGQVSEFITSGWNKNYIFNGIQDKFTGNPAHAIIWPDNQQPSALIPEGYITGAWFQVSLAPNTSKELVLYHLPHIPGPAYSSYQTAEFWADVVKNRTDLASIGKVTGTVTDSAGQPSRGVDIVLNTQSGSPYASATTDSRGSYSVYTVTGNVYGLHATNGTDTYDLTPAPELAGPFAQVDFTMAAPEREVTAGVTRGDPGFVYEGTSRDWWPKNDYYYIESPEIKFTVGTVRTAGMDPVDWSNDASGNNKWGTLTPGHIMDAVPAGLSRIENLDYTEFVLSDDLGVTPEDEANGKHMEWSWFHPLTKLEMPDIRLDGTSILAKGDWDHNAGMKSEVRYSIVDGTPLIRMEVTLRNETGADFHGNFGYIIDPDQPGEQHSYVPGRNWVFSQEKNPIRSGWTENYLFSGINNSFTGKPAHAIIWPQEQQPNILIHEGVFVGAWFEASIPNNGSRQYVIYHMPHIAGPADKPYAVAEFWAKVIREHGNPEDYGSISGTLRDEAGAPVGFTEVVSKDSAGQVMARAVTTADGQYQIFAAKGVYSVLPVNEAYSVQGQTVEIGERQRVQADFVLRKVADVAIGLPTDLTADTPFDVSVTVRNLTGNPLQNVAVALKPPYFVQVLGDSSITIPVIDARSQATFTVRAVALEGGRAAIQAHASNAEFQVTKKASFDVAGAGYYAGDNHTHTKHSDGVNTIAENSERVYNKRLLSWVWSTEHNKDSHKADAAAVTQSYDGKFLSLAGTEVTTPVGHALVYGLDGLPRSDIDNSGSGYTWQNSIDDITGRGGLVYIAHPFEQTYLFQNPYQWRGFTGVEVWNGTWHALDNGVNEKAFRFWDEINIRGEAKYYGIANTDGHTRDKVGDTYSKGWLAGLTQANVLELLRTGGYYGTNGPELRFSIGGVGMGGTLTLEHKGVAPFRIEAYDPNSKLTRVRVLRYPVTGNIADYDKRTVVLDEDLTSLQTNSFVRTVALPVSDREFYRLEVFSERANENSSGIGPLTGTGFAFSNPVWVEMGDSTNAAAITGLTYAGARLETVSRFGADELIVHASEFDPERLLVRVMSGAAVTSQQALALEGPAGTQAATLLQLTVTAKDGSSRSYEYLVYTAPHKGN
ncbi:CehA/McbA family metallohydrolase [Paenibacillus sp. HJGM_3]|uniref:CehA/McbA family metallohydrolase n=1 Tax=Paenibacillus sp. HJGM_3 TaxID=3379816 RepID=UPI00385BA281